jgi:hypothetical protein
MRVRLNKTANTGEKQKRRQTDRQTVSLVVMPRPFIALSIHSLVDTLSMKMALLELSLVSAVLVAEDFESSSSHLTLLKITFIIRTIRTEQLAMT